VRAQVDDGGDAVAAFSGDGGSGGAVTMGEEGVMSNGGGVPTGTPLADPPLIEEISMDPVLANTKLIAEAWDCDGLNQVRRRPQTNCKKLQNIFSEIGKCFPQYSKLVFLIILMPCDALNAGANDGRVRRWAASLTTAAAGRSGTAAFATQCVSL
jgi:hypothetical protein